MLGATMQTLLLVVFTFVLGGASCTSQKSAENGNSEATSATATQPARSPDGVDFAEPVHGEPVLPGTATYDGGLAKALFAGGCFWCMEPPFDEIDGVVATISGYAGSDEEDPKYKQVAYGRTGHTEAVLVIYEPDEVSYDELLDAFWRAHDPTDLKGQFVDRGSQYRPAIFAYDAEQQAAAEKSKEALASSGRFEEPVKTPVVEATPFWPAEEYHQDFYLKDPAHYKRYRRGSGRDQFLTRIWGSD